MKKKLTTFLAALLCMAGTSAWATDYTISTPQDLLDFATAVASDPTANATLTADIDMASQGWTGMNGFQGTFDGGGQNYF